MTLGERIRKLRNNLGLTQQAFADRIGMKRNSIAQVETGRKTSEQTIFSICREFNVSETWLRDGTGEMFLPTDRNADIARLTRQLLDEESDSFKNRFVSILANLSVEEWELLEKHARELYEGISKNKSAEKIED